MGEQPGGGQGVGAMRERILATAMRMVEEGAVEALTMRGLAAHLGVAPTAIYWHVGHRNDVLDALVDRLITEMGSPEPQGEASTDRLASIARWIRSQVQIRPHLIGLAHQQGRSGEVFFSAQAALARELSALGARGDEAALLVRSVASCAGGLILLEHALVGPRAPAGGHPTSADLWAEQADGIDASLATRLGEPFDFDELFEFSVAALLREVVGRAQRPR